MYVDPVQHVIFVLLSVWSFVQF